MLREQPSDPQPDPDRHLGPALDDLRSRLEELLDVEAMGDMVRGRVYEFPAGVAALRDPPGAAPRDRTSAWTRDDGR